MTQIKDLDKLKNLTKNELNVLIELLKISDQENNIFFNNNEREVIAENLDISRNGLTKFILSLQNSKKLLTKRNDFFYILNKDVFTSSNN